MFNQSQLVLWIVYSIVPFRGFRIELLILELFSSKLMLFVCKIHCCFKVFELKIHCEIVLRNARDHEDFDCEFNSRLT